ncbi:30S ribosomal protein S14, partial [Nocardioides sp.]
MAKRSKVAADRRRRAVVARYAERRAALEEA